MTAITTINEGDLITGSRSTINNNFSALNSGKMEVSALDTDNTLSADSDSRVPSQKAVKRYIDSNPIRLIPAGIIFDFTGVVIPDGYLPCDGSAVDRAIYADLFDAIGITWGSGNGTSTFNVPDFRGVVLVGAGSGTKVATFVSRSSDTLTVSGVSNISDNEFQTGQAVFYHTSATVITGLSNDTTYYVIRISNTTFKLATTLANAIAGTAITLSGSGSGTQTFTVSLTARTLADTGGEETHALLVSQIPAHTHTTKVVSGSGSGAVNASANSSTSNVFDSEAGGSTGGSGAHNNMQPFKVVTKIIKT